MRRAGSGRRRRRAGGERWLLQGENAVSFSYPLTGNASEIARLARSVGLRYTYDAHDDQFVHAAGLMIVTPQGKLARYFYGLDDAPQALRLGLVEAAANTIGSPIDQQLLFCYHSDYLTRSWLPISGW